MLESLGQVWPESGKNQGIWSESGPYGSVLGDTETEWIVQGLGSLWDASWPLKPLGKSRNPGFRGLNQISRISPYYPGLGL